MARRLNYPVFFVALVAWVGLQLVHAAVDSRLDSPWNNNVAAAPWNAGRRSFSSALDGERCYQSNKRVGGLDSPWNKNLDAPWNLESHLGAPWNVESHLGVPWNVESHLGAPWNVESHLGASWNVESHLGAPWNVESHLGAPWNVENHLNAPWNVENNLNALWNVENHLNAPWTSSGSHSRSALGDTLVVNRHLSSFYDALDNFFA